MNELVVSTKKTPLDVLLKIDDDGFTSTKKLYDFLQLDKTHYSRWIKKNIIDNKFVEFGVDYFYSPSKASDKRGNFADNYQITVNLAKKMSMMASCERGEQARNYFIACENNLKNIIIKNHQQELERIKSIGVRHILTDTIKNVIPESPHKKFAYPNYTKLIYKILFNKTPKELKLFYDTESIRDCLATDDLQDVQSAEMLVSSLINCGWGYDQIKKFLKTNLVKELQ